MTDLLWKFCHHGNEEARVEARLAILERGDAIVPELIQAVEEERQKLKRVHFEVMDNGIGPTYPSAEPLLRLAKLLAIYEHPESLLPLTLVAAWTSDTALQKPFWYVSTALERRGNSEDLRAFIDTLSQLRGKRHAHPKMLLLATALVRMAERDPKPELRVALPLLKPSLLTPWEFRELHQRLKAALGTDGLPIPAATGQTTEHLPIPAEESEI